MATYYYDTSAAAKHYRAEVGTQAVDDLLADSASRHYLSSLGIVEILSAFARLTRMGQVTALEFARLRARLLNDVASGLWQIVLLTPTEYQRAQELIALHAVAKGLRTLDALQLATALAVDAVAELDHFVCADANLCQVAAAENLRVLNPESA
jgi:predicted nucleic acid-binding protein